MSDIVNGLNLIHRYENFGEWNGWTDNEKELLLFALYATSGKRKSKVSIGSVEVTTK